MKIDKKYKETIHCPICKRPILQHEIDENEGIVYCYGCNHYFPFESKAKRGKRNEITIPNGADFIRLRIIKDELEIRIKWTRNYKSGKMILNAKNGILKVIAALAFIINRTEIKVNSDYIKIEHKPIDVLPMTYYRSNFVNQFYVKSFERVDSDFEPYYTNGLFADLITGEQKLILFDLRKTTLLFIEQEIERVLKIEDKEA